MGKFIILFAIFSGFNFITQSISAPCSNIINSDVVYESTYTETPTSNEAKQEAIFTSQQVPVYMYKNMLGKSIPIDYIGIVDINEYSLLEISYFGFDGNTYVGEMIVNSKVADEVLEIFRELYEVKYPIEKIRLIDEYNADDELSMSDNNTSCFCYRVIAGTSSLSNHAKRNCN